MRGAAALILVGSLAVGCGPRGASHPPPALRANAQALTLPLGGFLDQSANAEGMVSFTPTRIQRADPTPTISAWTLGPTLNEHRLEQAAAATSAFVWVSGGTQGGETLDVVEVLNATQPGASWQDTRNLPNGGRSEHASVAYNGYLYVLGGKDAQGNLLNDVSFAPIQSQGDLGSWAAATPIPGPARRRHSAVASAGFLYVVGGYGANGALTDVQIAQFEPDGSLRWLPSGPSLPVGLGAHASVAYHQHLYVLGGCESIDCAAPDATIWAAAVPGNGSVLSWTQTTNGLLTARADFGAVAANGYLYAVGGRTPLGGPTPVIEELPLSASGDLFTQGTANPVLTSLSGHSVVLAGSAVFAIGGAANGQDSDSVEEGALDASPPGLGAGVFGWRQSSPFPNGREGHAAAFAGGMGFVFGGEGDGGPLEDGWMRPLGPGSTGTWTDAGQVPIVPDAGPLAGEGLTAVGGESVIYLAGGVGGAGPYDNAVFTATFSPDAGLSSWRRYPYNAQPRTYHSEALYDGYLYVSGGQTCSPALGCSYLADLVHAPLVGAGVGGWSAEAPLGMGGRAKHCSVAYNGALYLLGGYDAFGDTDGGTDVLVLPLALTGGGTVPNALFRTAPMQSEHVSFVCGAVDGYLYAFGGGITPAPTTTLEVEYAPIHANATVGPWNTFDAAHLPRATVAAAGTLLNGEAILTGGYDTSAVPFTYYNDVLTGWLGPPSLAGEYSKLIDLGTQVDSVDTVTISGSSVAQGVRGQVSLEFEVAGADGGFLGRVGRGVIQLGVPQQIRAPNVRYVWIHLYLLDGQSGVLDPDAGIERDVTDMQIVYTNQPVQLAFVTPPRIASVGSCSGQVAVEVENDAGFSAPPPPGVVTPVAPGLSFFADPACTTPAASAGFAAGSSVASFYFTGADAGSYPLTVQLGTFSAAQTETVTVGDGGAADGGSDGGAPVGPVYADLGCGCGASASGASLAALFALLLAARTCRGENRR